MNLSLRKFLFIAASVLLLTCLSVPAAAAPTPAKEPLHLEAAKALQKGRSVVLIAETSSMVNLQRLRRFPDLSDSRVPYLCFSFQASGNRIQRRLCLGGERKPRHVAGLSRLDRNGQPVGDRVNLQIRVKRPQPGSLVVVFDPAAAGLTPKTYSWRLIARQGGQLCRPGRASRRCVESLPARGRGASFEIKSVRATGCTAGGAGLVTHGPRNNKVVALTFDDGPSEYTNGFLDVLRDKGVRGTFYVLGSLVGGRADTARRIVAEGHEIANHSWKHDMLPGYGDLSQTSSTIRSVTGFKPCTFRPPGGAQNSAVIAGAGRAGMKTVLWDVDPMDWRLPGTESIYRAVTGSTKPGSIILTHDGGGPRSQTLAALPRIIDSLRARGYSFTTVAELLGGRFRYGST